MNLLRVEVVEVVCDVEVDDSSVVDEDEDEVARVVVPVVVREVEPRVEVEPVPT